MFQPDMEWEVVLHQLLLVQLQLMNYSIRVDDMDPELLYYAGSGEKASAGVVHYDNVAASLFGGFVVVSPNLRHRR